MQFYETEELKEGIMTSLDIQPGPVKSRFLRALGSVDDFTLDARRASAGRPTNLVHYPKYDRPLLPAGKAVGPPASVCLYGPTRAF